MTEEKKREARSAAYRAGQYTFSVPPVYTGGWDEQAWCNHVHFNNPELNGFLPYIHQGIRHSWQH